MENMMIKKYLKTPEDILALKDTDTKIYVEGSYNYYRFIGGCLCWFSEDGSFDFNTTMSIGEDLFKKYIEVEEPVKEADENDIGKLCWFWDEENRPKQIEILKRFEPILTQMRYTSKSGSAWKYCRRLTPAEVAKITGYKVEK
jgi:hypothetical protein